MNCNFEIVSILSKLSTKTGKNKKNSAPKSGGINDVIYSQTPLRHNLETPSPP